VGVSSQELLGLSNFSGFLVGLLSEVPDNERLVSGSGDKELLVGVLGDLLLADLEAGDPAVMALKETSVLELVLLLLFFFS
jgi:hypothetical protein